MGRNFLSSSWRNNLAFKDGGALAFAAGRQSFPTRPAYCRPILGAIALFLLSIGPSSFGAPLVLGDMPPAALLLSKNEQILLDTPLPEVPPPMESTDSLNADFKARHDKRLNKEEKSLGPAEERLKKKAEKFKNTKIVEEILKDKPLVMQMAASLVVPHVITSGNERKNYTVEPTAHVHLYVRPSTAKLDENIQFWTGFRLAPFYGAATYQNISGRYGFSYFGPMLGMGALTSAPRSVSKELSESGEGPGAFHRYGFFFMGGIAAQSREAVLDRGVRRPTKELNTKGVSYDAPGLWIEYTVVSMDYNAISYNYTLGAQTGEAKVFVYLGIGTGFWN